MPEPKELTFQGMQPIQGTPIVAMLLTETDGDRAVIIGMGPPDAYKIMSVLEEQAMRAQAGGKLPDEALGFFMFLQQLLKATQSELRRVVITSYDGAMWRSTLHLKGPQGDQELVCRASDGVALAMATGVKIYATDEALNVVGAPPPDPGPGPLGIQPPFGPGPTGPRPPMGGPRPFGQPGPFGSAGPSQRDPFGVGGPFGPPTEPRGMPGPFGPGGPPPHGPSGN